MWICTLSITYRALIAPFFDHLVHQSVRADVPSQTDARPPGALALEHQLATGVYRDVW